MQFGEFIANLFAALLLAAVIAGVFLAFGRSPWPERRAEMTVLFPTDATTTGSVRGACFEPCLPSRFDLERAPPRPSPDQL
ncbi:polymerase [Mesorhizobium sp.]|uniref:polymerase n=1 Tax=Mesorhizobium sp. TaxID=1871066 RepID=UPI000FE3FF15|nr:polymerase [Mesorhizobium sp.]RWA65449.1 MAG: polymerase [Mesorhizobium sp.]RWB95316.1 MAG: polymerase [Mesorhizobium sp.]RWG79244.1 MAG: polymerase [Mesorhizobium sp.]RWG83550.1 MAG: polymerase [Mesorhizobium sp.]RWK11567.1 MAG: polymerase [Mesorhizobium sp.]